jgi:hypothetical protein
MKKALCSALCSALLATLSPSAGLAHSYTGECTVDFDNLFALTHTYQNARNTFASSTGLAPDGTLQVCAPENIACWTYRHRCGSNYINIDDDSGYGHYHLSFSHPGFDGSCGFSDPGDGGGAGMMKKVTFGALPPWFPGISICVVPTWKTEPRVLNTHDSAQWISIFVESSATHLPKVFDLTTISIGGSIPIQFWFHTTSGQWWYWSSLNPGNRDLSAWVHDVDEVRIRAANGQVGPVTINQFHILD